MQPDDSGNEPLYGHDVHKEFILDGKVPVPPQADVLVGAVGKGTRKLGAHVAPMITGQRQIRCWLHYECWTLG